MFGDDILPYLPDNIRPLAKQLKQFPANYEKWVYAPAFRSRPYQEDVFTEVPLVFIDEDGAATRAQLHGMVISNACDAQTDQGDFVIVAPVIDLKMYQETSELKGEELSNHIRALTENKISNLLFLPAGQGGSDAFVDFSNLCSVSSAYFHKARGQNRIISLSLLGHYFLLIKLAYHFTRPESADAVR